jgi:hypothetical protein
MKYSFLEFDEQKATKHIESLIADESGAASTLDVIKFIQGCQHQHSKDLAIMKQLIEIIEMQNEALSATFPGMKLEIRQHHDSTLAAVENKLKELSK